MYVERRSSAVRGTVWRVSPATGGTVLPDGCMDLLWMDGALHVAGPDTRAQQGSGETSEPAAVTGLRLDPGIAPGLLGVPAEALRDQRVLLSDLWPSGRVLRWTTEVHRDGPVAVLQRLAAAFDDGPSPGIVEVARLCDADRPSASIAADVGWSERTLHRRCLAAFGYGSKTLTRVLRFQRAVRRLHAGESAADVAASTGYADQAHLTREVSALAGTSPARLVRASADLDAAG